MIRARSTPGAKAVRRGSENSAPMSSASRCSSSYLRNISSLRETRLYPLCSAATLTWMTFRCGSKGMAANLVTAGFPRMAGQVCMSLSFPSAPRSTPPVTRCPGPLRFSPAYHTWTL